MLLCRQLQPMLAKSRLQPRSPCRYHHHHLQVDTPCSLAPRPRAPPWPHCLYANHSGLNFAGLYVQ